MSMTTTETNWLRQFTTTTRRVYEECIRLRKRDFDDDPLPSDVAKLREENKRLHERVTEHDGIFAALFQQMTVSLGGLMKFDEKMKNRKRR